MGGVYVGTKSKGCAEADRAYLGVVLAAQEPCVLWWATDNQAELPHKRVSELHKMVEISQMAHVSLSSYQGNVILRKRSRYFEPPVWLRSHHLGSPKPVLTEAHFVKETVGVVPKNSKYQGWACGGRRRGHPQCFLLPVLGPAALSGHTGRPQRPHHRPCLTLVTPDTCLGSVPVPCQWPKSWLSSQQKIGAVEGLRHLISHVCSWRLPRRTSWWPHLGGMTLSPGSHPV